MLGLCRYQFGVTISGMGTNASDEQTVSPGVAAEIRAELGRQKMSGRALARLLDRSPNWVSMKISGAHRIDVDELEVIARVLGLTIADLLPAVHRATTRERGRNPSERSTGGVGERVLVRRVGSAPRRARVVARPLPTRAVAATRPTARVSRPVSRVAVG